MSNNLKTLRTQFSSSNFRKNMIEQLGKTCVNCSSNKDIEYHHIVPLVNGGTNNLSNIVPLCKECHCKAHDKEYRHGCPSSGRPKKYNIEDENVLNVLHKYFNLEIGKKEAMELLEMRHKTNTSWDRIIKEYKIKYNIPDSFKNTIDCKEWRKRKADK